MMVTMIGAIAPVGTSCYMDHLFLALAMQLGGGCGSGTLFTAGSGNLKMVSNFSFFYY